jgi:hypothetical protein
MSKNQLKLPRTGIEQPFMKEIPHFIEAHREFERIAVVNVSETFDIISLLNFQMLALADITSGTRGTREWNVD